MYYVTKGKKEYFVARGPKGLLKELDALDNVRAFDYDDNSIWPDDALKFERRRVEDDPWALTALDAERDRRSIPDKNYHAPWFDDAAEMMDDLSMALEQEDYLFTDEDDDEDWDDRRPIILPRDVDDDTMALIHALAELENKVENREFLNPLTADYAKTRELDEYIKREEELRKAIMKTEFAMQLTDGDDPVEDMKVVAAHLFFLYSSVRKTAEWDGAEVNEDFYYAGTNLYNYAIGEQAMEEDDDDWDDEDWDEEDWDDDEDYSSPDDVMGMFARLFSDHIKEADIEDPYLQEMGESTEYFLTEKGFDLTTLSGLKRAQKWLEGATAEDAFWTEGPVDNEVDKHLGEARIAAMLKIVKKKIEEKLK